jgi:hypothetical protein
MEHFPSNRLKKMIAAEERILEQKDISLQNWGACVDAVFWHVLRESWKREMPI